MDTEVIKELTALRGLLLTKEHERDLFVMRLHQINQLVDKINAESLDTKGQQTVTTIKKLTDTFEGNL